MDGRLLQRAVRAYRARGLYESAFEECRKVRYPEAAVPTLFFQQFEAMPKGRQYYVLCRLRPLTAARLPVPARSSWQSG